MIKNILKWISSTDNRLNRLAYILIIVFNFIAYIIVWFIWPIIFDPTNVYYSNYIFFLQIPFIAFWLIASINRFHDMNKTWWFILLEFIPIINFWILIWLLVAKGTKGTNKFGLDPLGITSEIPKEIKQETVEL
jgi:uncharacterized membrane protein YhaH (DUF805 family)